MKAEGLGGFFASGVKALSMGIEMTQRCGNVEGGIFCDELAREAGKGGQESLAHSIHESGCRRGAEGSGDIEHIGGVRYVADDGGRGCGEAGKTDVKGAGWCGEASKADVTGERERGRRKVKLPQGFTGRFGASEIWDGG